MKIIGVSCSPRKGGTTAEALGACLEAAKDVGPGMETELFELAGLEVRGCLACGRCSNALVIKGKSRGGSENHRQGKTNR